MLIFDGENIRNMDVEKESIIYVYPNRSSFILRDVEILSSDFQVKDFFFRISDKKRIPFEFIRQFFFLLRNLRSSKGVICHFAGYSSVLPSIMCRLFRRPCLIIVAGNDASRFPDFSYGNYTRKMLGFVTGFSLRNATHILPVHESLYFQDYSYYEGGKPAQGYSYFYPKAKDVPYTAVYYGYDSVAFNINPAIERKKNTFVTTGNLSDTYSFKRKGYDLIIELARLRPDYHFTLVGWDGKRIFDFPENVTLLPYINQSEIIQVFNESQFYLQLSIMEGFPNALAESMLCGCIPIGSSVSGIPYIIQDTGYILDENNIDKLCSLIDAIQLEPEEELARKSAEARKRVAGEFTFENRKNKILQILGQYNKK